jgi:hypothetical protein
MNMTSCFRVLCYLVFSVPVALMAQDIQRPRTIKFYPLRIFAGELLLGYEHGVGRHLSATVGLGLHGSGVYMQASELTPGTAANYGCRSVMPASGITLQAGPRWYPGKMTRKGPFFLEMLLVYRRTDYESFREYGSIPCNASNALSKEIRPLITRTGVQLLCGGALRRDKRFTMDMFGGLGLRNEYVRERQTQVPGGGDDFYAIEPPTKYVVPSAHLGLSLGFNFAATRRR